MNIPEIPIIIGKNLTFSYQNRLILDSQNFTFYKGEHIGIIGESGTGKSTFLRLLAGLLRPSCGELTVDGESEGENITRKITFVMQESRIMPLSIKDNILLGKEISEDRLNEILRQARLYDWICSLENGPDTYLGDRANELSGGQAQRIAIARAMVKDCNIVLLDEPTSSLDKKTSEEVMESLNALTKGKTVIHVTHHPDLLKDYDRIIQIREGRLYE